MKGNKKVLVIISSIMLLFLIVTIVVLTINFKKFSQEKEFDKANIIASLVKDGLTAHMVSGTMSQRKLFLDNVKKSSGALDIWIFRTSEVVQEFGKGFPNEKIRDSVDKKMIDTKQIQQVFHDNVLDPTIRITIPYIATSKSNPNCLNCHTNAKEGDVLGGISMVHRMGKARLNSIVTILKIFGISSLFIILFIFVANKLLKPYLSGLDIVKESLKKANYGDYSSRIEIKGDNESVEVFMWINTLLEKLEETIGTIEKNISLFVSDRRQTFKDPLEKSKCIVEDIAMLYKFKRVIEQDKSKHIIYQRLVRFFKEHLAIKNFSFYEIDIKKDIRLLIYEDVSEDFCQMADVNSSENCRAFRTNSIVSSDDFDKVCQSCKVDRNYLCINYQIDENISLVLNIKPKDEKELFENKKAIGYIKNYLESARPVLQNKILTEILQKSNMTDGLTKLHNRKYLDIFMGATANNYKRFAVAMVDIDFFKKVNDTYGHDAGDIVLKRLGEMFKKSIHKEDIAFRFGGEEFLIFMPNAENAKETSEKIRKVFEDSTFEVNGKTIKKTLSVGVAIYPQDNNTIWGVVKCSDIALYHAKENGRNKVVFYDSIEDKDQRLMDKSYFS